MNTKQFRFKQVRQSLIEKDWWGRQDSNLGSHGPKPRIVPSLTTTPRYMGDEHRFYNCIGWKQSLFSRYNDYLLTLLWKQEYSFSTENPIRM